MADSEWSTLIIFPNSNPRPKCRLQTRLAQIDFNLISIAKDRAIAGPVSDGSEFEELTARRFGPYATSITGQRLQGFGVLWDKVSHEGPSTN